MSNCQYSNCPHYGKTSCAFTTVNGTWKCTKVLDGKTFKIRTSTTGTVSTTKEKSDGTRA